MMREIPGYFGTREPIKTFPEVYEIKVRKMVGKNIESETRTDGEVANVVKDIDKLIIDIMEFIETCKK